MEETEGMSDGMNEERAAAPEEEPKAGEGAVKGRRTPRARSAKGAAAEAARTGRVRRKKTESAAPVAPAAETSPEEGGEPEIVFPEDGVMNTPPVSDDAGAGPSAVPAPDCAEPSDDAVSDDPEIPFPEEGAAEASTAGCGASPSGDGSRKEERASGEGSGEGRVRAGRAAPSAMERLRNIIRRFFGRPSRLRKTESDDPELMRLRALRRFRGAGEEEKSRD